MHVLDYCLRLFAAIFLGCLVGVERQLTGNHEGIRMNVLVSLGSCMFVLFSVIMEAADPTRTAAQIVSGVGFLCSAIIFKDGIQVRGLRTAATIWCSAAIGVLCSSGKIAFAFIATMTLLLSNVLLRPLSGKIHTLSIFDENEKYYMVSLVCTESKEMALRSLIMNHFACSRLTLMNLESNDLIKDGAAQQVEITAMLCCTGRRRDEEAEKIIEKLSLEHGVLSAGWEMI